MKLSYSTALFLPPVLSNLDTSKSSTVGETEYPRSRRASRSSGASILPLRSRSNLSNMPCTINMGNVTHGMLSQLIGSLTTKQGNLKLYCCSISPSNSEDCKTQK
uniref:Uncharacterized protein n=1 Tax=Triticum urartu TaxID=4572 RepID=A0A8R7Q167_TRIUA